MQKDSADPLDGWNVCDVETYFQTRGELQPLKNDLYGHLYFYLLGVLTTFHERLRSTAINFTLFALKMEELHGVLGEEENRYDRIDVSNIVDANYLGVHTTLNAVRPLLRQNSKYATVVSLFLNALQETRQYHQRDLLDIERTLKLSSRYLGMGPPPDAVNDPKFLRMSAARQIFSPHEDWFREYTIKYDVERAAAHHGMVMKDKNTVVPKWPYRLMKKFGEAGAQEEFDALLASGLSGTERYVEWKLT